MAITRPIRTLVARGLAAALVLGAAGCSTYPAAPAQPAFDTDVLPIFQAHCTRCHDNNPDGGLLQPVYVPGVDGGTVKAKPPHLTVFGPCYPSDGGAPFCYLPSYESILTRIHLPENDPLRMPLAPSRLLDEWEINVIDTWFAEKPGPICSKSAHPDPALLCP